MSPLGELVRLEIPAQPAFVGVARTVVAAVAYSLDGIDDDRLEDLRIAVSEACTSAVAPGSSATVVLRCLADDDRLEVHIEDSDGALGAEALEGGGGEGEQGWGLQLIRALVDDVAFEPASNGSATGVRLVVRRGAEPDDLPD